VIRCLLDYHADVSPVDCYGRTVVDWALLFSADYILREYRPADLRSTTVEEQQMVLYQTVQFICEMNIHSATMSYLDELARCLLYLDDVPSALKVFEQCTAIDGDVVIHQASCSLCKNRSSLIRGQRFVCLLCPTTNLCAQCFAGYENGTSTERCRGHGFLRIPTATDKLTAATDCPLVHLSSNERDQWLKSLMVRYQCISKPL
jgi:hypothetical protein